MPSSSAPIHTSNTGREVSMKPAFICPLLLKHEADHLVQVSGPLGHDPSSKAFTNRTKNIAFVICLSGRWFQINQDYFNQATDYNDFSGGYKRYYRQQPPSFIQSEVTQSLLNTFQSVYNIPEGELVLVQVQSSNVSAQNEGKCITGQGIHTDGADRAMLVCLERKNIHGARSSVYRDVYGHDPVVCPTVLEEGEVMFWKDNEIYHYVEPAKLSNKNESGTRTVLIAHYPAVQFITGAINPNNVLPPSGYHPPAVTAVTGLSTEYRSV